MLLWMMVLRMAGASLFSAQLTYPHRSLDDWQASHLDCNAVWKSSINRVSMLIVIHSSVIKSLNIFLAFLVGFEWSKCLWVCQVELYITSLNFIGKGAMRKNHNVSPIMWIFSGKQPLLPNPISFHVLFILSDLNNYAGTKRSST